MEQDQKGNMVMDHGWGHSTAAALQLLHLFVNILFLIAIWALLVCVKKKTSLDGRTDGRTDVLVFLGEVY